MSDTRKVGVAVIACGSRSRGVVNNLLRDSGRNVEILAAYDPIDSIVDKAVDTWNVDKSKFRKCGSYMEAIRTPGVEWVMVFSPNAFHKEHILAAFAEGKHVFSEKPLATSIEDCQKFLPYLQSVISEKTLFPGINTVVQYAGNLNDEKSGVHYCT